jgi:hypothetical protein
MGQANVRRTGEFDRALAATDNALNQIVKTVQNGNCYTTLVTGQFQPLTGCADVDTVAGGFQVYGRVSSVSFLQTSPANPISLFFADSATTHASTGVRVKCLVGNPSFKFVVTRVYKDGSGDYRVDQGITDCGKTNGPGGNNVLGNVTFFGINGGTAPVGLLSDGSVSRTDTKLVRVRPLDSSITANSVSIEIINTVLNTALVVATTGSYEFAVVGSGGLGSDVAIKFTKPRGDYSYVPSAFDFVYFGENL